VDDHIVRCPRSSPALAGRVVTWRVSQLLVHFVSAETQLLALTQEVAGGGLGAAPDFDIDRFNADEQNRLEGQSLPILFDRLRDARRQTIEWVKTLGTEQLDKIGQHPALGTVSVETMIKAIYGHQLIHMRDLTRLLETDHSHFRAT
jgi:hypothetical protein